MLGVVVVGLKSPAYPWTPHTLRDRGHSPPNSWNLSAGCKSAQVSAESRTAEAEVLTRRCVLLRIIDFSAEKWSQILAQSVAAVLILVPPEIPTTQRGQEQGFLEREIDILRNATLFPVYFAIEDEDLLDMYAESRSVSLSLTSASAWEVLLGMVMGSGFQMTTSEVQSKPITHPVIITLEGQLMGRGRDTAELPTIVIAAHYDSFGAAPYLAYGADSNGSGVAMLLEMIRLFHILYRDPRSQPRYNLLFASTGGGKFNYHGSKRWIEEHLDHSETSILHENVAFVLCLDTLANSDSLHLHVSRPPAEGTAQWEFMRQLQLVTQSPPFHGLNFSLVHKKINLGESLLAWEHEQFSLRRLPAFTVSHLSSHKSGMRTSILDTRSGVDVGSLRRNTEILCEALAGVVYGDTGKEFLFQKDLSVDEERLSSILDWLVSQPRAAQLINGTHPMLSTMEHIFQKHLKDVRRHVFKPDDRQPEFVFYDQMKQTMTSHRVKPAIFDLFMAFVIAAYLGLIHQAVQSFGPAYNSFIGLMAKQKRK